MSESACEQAIRAGFPTLEDAHAEIGRRRDLINTPLYQRFSRAVIREAIHQVERWGADHDQRKEPADWYWTLGYLAGKALQAHHSGDERKALHHTISSGALLLHWHAAVGGHKYSIRDLEQLLQEGIQDPLRRDDDD